MPDFTKGKWEVCDDGCISVFDDNYKLGEIGVIEVFGFGSIYDEDERKTAKANARLIAAAPEMYHLLEECADELGAIGLPTLSRECYDLLRRIDGEGEAS